MIGLPPRAYHLLCRYPRRRGPLNGQHSTTDLAVAVEKEDCLSPLRQSGAIALIGSIQIVIYFEYTQYDIILTVLTMIASFH